MSLCTLRGAQRFAKRSHGCHHGAVRDATAPDDVELAERLRAGDPEAVRDLYRRYGGAVLTVARAYVGDRATADEVVQHTFLNAWRAAGTLERDRSLSPWLYQIARRCAVDAIRRDVRQIGRPTAAAAEAAHGTGRNGDDPASTFEQSWEAFEVRRALDALPSAERETVRLAHLEGLTHTEVAARLDVPLGTVKSRLGRAYRRLEAALGHLAPANRPADHGVMEQEG